MQTHHVELRQNLHCCDAYKPVIISSATFNNWTCATHGMCWRCNVCNDSCSGSSFAEVAGRLLQLGGGPALVLRLLLARATRDLGSEVPHMCMCLRSAGLVWHHTCKSDGYL